MAGKDKRESNPNLIYCCDPVIGDINRGIFVRPGVPEFFRDQAIDEATILTPNQFELAELTSVSINTLADAKIACKLLHQRGVKYVLVTSLSHANTEPNSIEMLLSTNDNCYIIATPRLTMPIEPNGSGDMTAAIFLAKYLDTRNLEQSLAHTASSVYAVFEKTRELNRRELALIQAQTTIIKPTRIFPVAISN